MANFLLGIDIGSSSIKTTLLDAETGKSVSSSSFPKTEMAIIAKQPGWAEQSPEDWWKYIKQCILEIKSNSKEALKNTKAIGITYQMHGLVVTDKSGTLLRPSIIWCDSRAVEYGDKAFSTIGETTCLSTLLNSPGNFTASKLAWVKENEPSIYKEIDKIMLPGDYIAYKMTGEISTTVSGLSEGIFWDYKNKSVSNSLMNYYGFDSSLIPEIKDSFSVQGYIKNQIADELGLPQNIPVSYRAGDQPNNAFSLNVLEPGELATTAGTSGVIYGVSDKITYDPKSRVNTFVHVNNDNDSPRYGILLCLNGTGILNRWLKQNIVDIENQTIPYHKIDNEFASPIPVGSEGLVVLPYGNGSERTLENKDLGCSLHNLNFNIHSRNHILRAGQEGIVFALNYGIDIMKKMGINMKTIKAGHTNMFLSKLFTEAFANTTGSSIELYSTDGSEGAARGAGIGAKIYKNYNEAFENLDKIKTIEPETNKQKLYNEAYNNWLNVLEKNINS